MADPIQMPRLDTYAQDLLRQSYQQTPISPENLARFGQGMMQQVPAPPQIESYAAPQQIQPDPRRLDYANLIEQRFNELAQAVGGVEELIATGTVDMARQRAQKDVEMQYGAFKEPVRVIDVEGTKVATGGDFRNPVILPSPTQSQLDQLAVEKAQQELAQAKATAAAQSGKATQESATSAGALSMANRILSQAREMAQNMKNSPTLSSAVGGGDPIAAGYAAAKRSIPGTPEYDFASNAGRLKSAAFSEAIKMLQGMGALSNQEGTAITSGLTDVDNLGQSPEQYKKRLDEFIGTMDVLLQNKQNAMNALQSGSAQAPKLNLETFDLSKIDVAPTSEDTQKEPKVPSVSSPGAVTIDFDPTTRKPSIRK
jgi:hypothetical protein